MTSPSRGSITDVPGIRVGQVEKTTDGWLTGVTVVLPDSGSIGGVDVRGGGPGTHETDALEPRTQVNTVDAVVLTGGSAFGLVTAHGAQRWCAENRRGLRVDDNPDNVVPIVPAAAIYDLGRGGEFWNHPTADMGYEAATQAGAAGPFAPIARGNVGAGTGGALGLTFKGGTGSASIRLGGDNSDVVVGAIVIVNAVGRPWLPAAQRATLGDDAINNRCAPGADTRRRPIPTLNTTIAVVATNATLDAAEASRTATAAHDGFARALNPVHTLRDGDTIFTVATGKTPLAGDDREERIDSLFALQVAAAEAIRLAIFDAIESAKSVSTPGGNFDQYPLPADLDWSYLK